MEVNVAASAGFCFGVKRAVRLALRTARGGRQVCMLGDIVHNEAVIRELEQAGVRKIRRLGTGAGRVLLIRAHGAGRKVVANAVRRGYEVVDATCPMVQEIHRIVRNQERQGRRIIVIGDRDHDEVRGIAGQLRTRAVVIGAGEKLPVERLGRLGRAAVVVQSTQPLDRTLRMADAITKLVADVRFFNTICNPTRTKQDEIRRLAAANDVMVIIGSRTSANTKRLYEIARALNPGTWWVQSRDEIDPAWFEGVKRAGVGAGASTPDSVTDEAVEYLKSL